METEDRIKVRYQPVFNCLFWNAATKDLRESTALLARERNVDVIVLAEPGTNSTDTLAELRKIAASSFCIPEANTDRVHVFSRAEDFGLQEIDADAGGRWTVRTLNWNGTEFLIAAAHLVSKVN